MGNKCTICSHLVSFFCCLMPFVLMADRATLDYQCWVAMGAVVLSLAVLSCVKWNAVLSLTVVDVAVFFYLLYGAVRFWGNRENLPLAFLPEWTMLVCLYLLMRNAEKRLFGIWIGMACLAQVVLAVGQQAGYWAGGHALFRVTGSFWNPSQLGGFIACFLPLFVAEWKERRRAVHWGWAIPPMLYVLALSDSRAAWLAAVVGILYMLWPKLKKGIRWGIVAAVCLAGVGLFFYRPLSAMGRLHVWQICCDMVQDHPLWGSGLRSFAGNYMLYQADYFHSYPDAAFAESATVIATPYNEFVHVLVEQGVMGMLLLLGILGACFLQNENAANRKWQGVVMAFAVFACFSYPAANIALMAGVAACLGAIRGKEKWQFRLPKTARRTLWAGVLAVATGNTLIASHYLSLAHRMKNDPSAMRIADLKNEPEAAACFLQARDSLSDAKILEISIGIAKRLPSPATFCEVGRLLESHGDYEEAERWYRRAADMVPNQVRANYCLFRLYKNTNRPRDAFDMALRIKNQTIKIENSFTLSVQGEVSRYLKNRKHE